MKIRIVTPLPADVKLNENTDKCIRNLIKERSDITFDVVPIYGSQIYSNRNLGVTTLNGLSRDYCLQIDNRKTFTVDDFNQLLNMDTDVASGWYTIPSQKKDFASYFDYDENEDAIRYEAKKEKKIIEIPFFGTGFHLVKTSVYKKMDKAGITEHYFPAMRKGKHVSEDIGFCDNLKKIGVTPKINLNVFIERQPLPFLKEQDMGKKIETKTATNQEIKKERMLKDLNLTELKSVAYDLIAQNEMIKRQLSEVNAMIAEKSK